MSTISDLEILTDMLFDDTIYDEVDKMEECKPKEYYHGKALYIRKQLTDNDNYFYFLESFLKDFNLLSEEQKTRLKEIMHIRPEVIVKEKLVAPKKKKKNNKPQLNMDDY